MISPSLGLDLLADDDMDVLRSQPGHLESAGDRVVVGDGDGFEPRFLAGGQQLLGCRRAIAGKVRVHMKIGEDGVARVDRLDGASVAGCLRGACACAFM